LRRCRELTIARYRRAGPPYQLHAWFSDNRVALENGIGGRPATGPAMLMILGALDLDSGCVADLSAVNRWRNRAAVPLEEYLHCWQQSCTEIGAPGRLPIRIRDLLFFDEPAPTFYNNPSQANLQWSNRGDVRQLRWTSWFPVIIQFGRFGSLPRGWISAASLVRPKHRPARHRPCFWHCGYGRRSRVSAAHVTSPGLCLPLALWRCRS
jgi:hypothetical protein